MLRILLLFALLSMPGFAAHYAVILNGEPAGSVSAQGRTAVAAARQRVIGSHAAVRNVLRGRGLRITGEANLFLNAIFIEADASQIAGLETIAGVRQVARLKRFHPTLDHGEQLINVPAAWALAGGLTNAGAGIKIAIIDTGIEATHPAFQDSSLMPPAGFPVCPTPSDCVFTNSKIIVARSYVSLLNSFSAPTSRPDDYSARDRVGHGTAVAMAAAGNTAVGPSDTITGVAPKAFLGNYKVFGSPGVNDFTTGDAVITALEDAYIDGMDIAVLSLGAPALSGPLDPGPSCGLSVGQTCDPEATAVQLAVTAGLMVVVAAGNDGTIGLQEPGLSTIDTPGTAPAAITVAATTNSHNWSNQLTVNGLGSFHSLFGDGPAPTATVTGQLGDVASAGDPQACNGPAPGSLSGLIVLIARGTCTFLQKVQNAETAGVAGVIFTNNPGDDTLVVPSGLGGTTIPASFIGYTDGQTIRAFLAANPKTTVNIAPNLVSFGVSTYNEMTSFSSRGPVLGSGALKPDVGAAGENLYLAGETYDPNGEFFSANGFLVSQGTSFSTPQIAGIVALAKQSLTALSTVFPDNPTLQAAALKSAVVNSASQDITDSGATASVTADGAGNANAASAVVTQLVANPASISFGVITTAVLPLTQQIQLTNISNAPLTLSVALNRRTAENNAQTTLNGGMANPISLTVAAGQTTSFNLKLAGTVPSPGIYEGFVTVSGAANPVKIPYLYVVGNGQAYNLLSLAGNGDDGTVSQQSAGGYVIFRIIDQYGVPVVCHQISFSVTSGDGQLRGGSTSTDSYGIGFAELVLGSTPGANVYTATACGLSTTFTATGRLQPTIAPNGVLNGASYTQPVAPGSYVSIFGVALADTTASYSTSYLPVSINNVSVSFDAGTISVPGHLTYVSPGQVNVQVPWELEGATTVQMKVSLEDSSGTVYNLPLTTYAPALFEAQGIAAALDESNNPVSASNPVAQGHVVQLFANGLGPVSNQPASGNPSPFSPDLAIVTGTPLTVTIGGLPATVQFAGLSPGSVGLYQVNAVVPNTGAGVQAVAVSVGGVSSPAVQLPVK
jgi:uncharacterized protein (TIGR03437 family)